MYGTECMQEVQARCAYPSGQCHGFAVSCEPDMLLGWAIAHGGTLSSACCLHPIWIGSGLPGSATGEPGLSLGCGYGSLGFPLHVSSYFHSE